MSDEAAERIGPLKKADMAVAAEQHVAGTGWLPELLRLPDLPTNDESVEALDGETGPDGGVQTLALTAE